MRSGRRRSSSICRGSRCSRRSPRETRTASSRSPTTGATSRIDTDWRDLVARPDIDLIDIASPNDTHHEIAIAAAKAGKMVMCEKPLGRNAKEASEMVAAVEAAGVPNSGLVQLPPRAGRHADQAAGRREEVRAHLSLPREVPAGLDDLAATCRRAAKGCGASTCRWRAAASPAICWRTTSTRRCG